MLGKERFSRLRFPVHKIDASTPEEIFNILPGLRRYFDRVNVLYADKHTTITINTYPVDPDDPKGGRIKEEVDVKFKTGEVIGIDPASSTLPTVKDVANLIRYVVFLYDPESDLTDEYPDEIQMRKEAAAREAGWTRNSGGNWPKFVVDIMEFRNANAIDIIIDFLKARKNPTWTQLKFIDEEIDSLYRARAEDLRNGEVRNEQMNKIKEREAEKERLLKQFYSHHSDLKKVTEEELLPVSPENIFKELKVPETVWKLTQVTDVPTPAQV